MPVPRPAGGSAGAAPWLIGAAGGAAILGGGAYVLRRRGQQDLIAEDE